MTQCSVLRVNAVEEQAAYRQAIAEILRNIQLDYDTTLQEIAEKIDVSLGTISNAANKKADLGAIYLNRLGRAYAPHVLDPYAKLAGGRVVARESGDEKDVLPILTMTAAQIAEARSPHSPGGVVETLRERLGYLPFLRTLRRQTDALIKDIEDQKDAA